MNLCHNDRYIPWKHKHTKWACPFNFYGEGDQQGVDVGRLAAAGSLTRCPHLHLAVTTSTGPSSAVETCAQERGRGLHTYTYLLENGGRSLWWEQAGAFRPQLMLVGEEKGQALVTSAAQLLQAGLCHHDSHRISVTSCLSEWNWGALH